MGNIRHRYHRTGTALCLLAGCTLTMADGKVYSAFDSNADGYLDHGEYAQYLKKRRIKPAYREIWEFRRVDQNGDLRISGEELMQALKNEISMKRRGRY